MGGIPVRTLKIPIELWAAAAAKADKEGLSTTIWMLLVLAKAVKE